MAYRILRLRTLADIAIWAPSNSITPKIRGDGGIDNPRDMGKNGLGWGFFGLFTPKLGDAPQVLEVGR